MERSDHPRVVVVGGGIIGSAIAMHLAERGLRPLLVDEDRAGEAASARSFASLSAFGNDPVAYYELACAALASWSRWAKRLGEVGYRRGGELRCAADPQQGRELAEQVERARSRGYPIVPVDETDLRQLLPAAEAESVAVARAVGLDVATLASPGLLVQTEPLPAFTDKVVYLPGGPGPQVHLRQRPDGSVLLGERSQEMVTHDPSERHARALLNQAARFLPVLHGARIARTLLAWRSMLADRLPIVGRVPGLDSLYLAVTHCGVMLAPALGRLVADEIATGEPQWLLTQFRPGRFNERATRVVLDVEELFR